MADSSWFCQSPDEVDLFPPVPEYGLWCGPATWSRTYRNNPQNYQQQLSGIFSVHNSLSQVKSAITKDVQYFSDPITNTLAVPGVTIREYRIYERHKGKWVEIYRIETGVEKKKHELWAKGAAPKVPIAVDEDDIQAAIASITGG